MITPQLLDYIKTSVASRQSREVITQALAQSGWSIEDINQGFANTATSAPIYSAPVPTMVLSTSVAHSKLPMILGAVAVIVVLAVAGGLVWADQQVKSDEVKVTDIVAPIATTSESVAVNIVGTSTTIAAKSATSSGVKSEIDEYGTDLYTLKQGVTTINKTATKTEIVYTRNGDEIERKVMTTDTIGGKSTATLTISLKSREQMLAYVKDIGTKLASCSDTVSGDCRGYKVFLDFINAKCINLQGNVEISKCMIAATMSVWASQTQ